MSETKIAGPWEQDERGGWRRIGVNGIPMAEVWPRGYAAYGWAGGDGEGLASVAFTSSGNLAAAKQAADAALTAIGCDLIEAWPVTGHTVHLQRPFDARCAEFVAGLRQLSKKTGVHLEGPTRMQATEGSLSDYWTGPDGKIAWGKATWPPPEHVVKS